MWEGGNEQLISGERPTSSAASGLGCHQTLSVIQRNAQGGFSSVSIHCVLCARRSPAWLATKQLWSVITPSLEKTHLHLGSASDHMPKVTSCWKTYQCTFLFIHHSQVWLAFLYLRLGPSFLFKYHYSTSLLALWDTVSSGKGKIRAFISTKISRRQELALASSENSCFQENYSPNGCWGHWPDELSCDM